MKVKIYFDNLVTDDPITEIRECFDLDAAYKIAYELSKRTGLSVGNYQVAILLRSGCEIHDYAIECSGCLTKDRVIDLARWIAKDATEDHDIGLAMAFCELVNNYNYHHGDDQLFYIWQWRPDVDFELVLEDKRFINGKERKRQ